MADLDDVKSVALSVLRHRVVINFAAEAAGRSAEDVCRELIEQGGLPEYPEEMRETFRRLMDEHGIDTAKYLS